MRIGTLPIEADVSIAVANQSSFMRLNETEANPITFVPDKDQPLVEWSHWVN